MRKSEYSKLSPEQRAKELAAKRHRYATDPEYRARIRKYGKEYKERREKTLELLAKWRRQNVLRYADPEYRAKLLERRKKYGATARNRRKHRYGITQEDYDRMFRTQMGRCALCFQPPDATSSHNVLAIDHDHETGRVRGLLCFVCNHGLGGYERFLKNCGTDAVQRYLDGWPQRKDDDVRSLTEGGITA